MKTLTKFLLAGTASVVLGLGAGISSLTFYESSPINKTCSLELYGKVFAEEVKILKADKDYVIFMDKDNVPNTFYNEDYILKDCK